MNFQRLKQLLERSDSHSPVIIQLNPATANSESTCIGTRPGQDPKMATANHRTPPRPASESPGASLFASGRPAQGMKHIPIHTIGNLDPNNSDTESEHEPDLLPTRTLKNRPNNGRLGDDETERHVCDASENP